MNLKIDEYDKLKNMFSYVKKNDDCELEALINSKKDKIQKKDFEKILFFLKTNYEMEEHLEKLDISLKNKNKPYLNSIRASITGLNNIQKYCKNNKLKDTNAEYLSKKKIQEPLDISGYNLRFNLKKETIPDDIDEFNNIIDNLPKYYRLKKRFSFKSEYFRFDLSIVKNSNMYQDLDHSSLLNSGLLNNKETYEIEIEFINSEYKNFLDSIEDNKNNTINTEDLIKKFIKNISTILQIKNNSELIMDSNKIKTVKNNYLKLTNDNWIGPQPVTLELKNLLSDNIRINKNDIDGPIYSVTDKADGSRTVMFVDDDYSIYFVSRIKKDLKIINSGYELSNKESKNIIFDGELTFSKGEDGNLDKNKQLYLIFDMYFIDKEDIRSEVLYEIDSKISRYSRIKNLTIYDKLSGFNKIEITKKLNKTNKSLNLDIFLKNFQFSSDIKKGKEEKKIFTCSNKILNLKKMYETDGLIFTPENYAVSSKIPGTLETPISNTGITWNYVFKWKPPDQNSIDFTVVFDSLEKINGDFYRILSLRVGMSSRDYYDHNICRSLFDEKKPIEPQKKDSYLLVEFNPDDKDGVNKAKIKMNEDGKIFANDGKEILDNTVVEFTFDYKLNNWIPLRLRSEKEFGNNFKTAYSVWNSIQNPVTEEMIRKGTNLKNIDLETKYYADDGNQYMRNMRLFHNIIKKKLIQSVSVGKKSLLDLAVGRGGDLQKWIDSKLELVVGIDIGKEGLENNKDGACKRYHKLLMQKKPDLPEVYFIWGDCSKNIKNGDSGLDDENKEHLKILWGTDNNLKNHRLFGKVKEKFDVVSCQFGIHYFLENKDKFNQFVKNIAENLKTGGYFICSTLDGDIVHSMLQSKKKGEAIIGENDDGEEIWKIIKDYDNNLWDNADINSKFGAPIIWSSKTINPNTEYLVDSGTINHVMNLYGLELSKPIKKNDIKQSDNYFSELFKFIDKKNRLSDYEKEYSSLNKWFIFKKKEVSDNIEVIIKKK